MSGIGFVSLVGACLVLGRLLGPGPANARRVRARLRAASTDGAGGRRSTLPRETDRAGGVRVSVLHACSAVGRVARRLARQPADPARDLRVGAALVAGVAVLFLAGPAPGLVALFVVWAVPIQRARATRRRRTAQVLDEVPEVIDLFRLAFGAGLNVRLAVTAVTQHGRGVIVDQLLRANDEIERGDRVADVLANLCSHPDLGDPVRPLLDALVATERYGAPIGLALERAADDGRLRRRRRHEELARRVPVKLLFPLVCCTLPALALLTVIPALARSLPGFGR